MINIEVETQQVVERFVAELLEKQTPDAIAAAEAIKQGDFSSAIAQQELIPQLEELQQKLTVRKYVVNELTALQQVATALNNSTDRIKLEKAIAEAELDVFNHPAAKRSKKDILDKIRKEKKDSRCAVSKMTLDETIDEYNFHQVAVGNVYWFYQSKQPNEYGQRAWHSLRKDALLANFPATAVRIRGGEGEADYIALNDFCARLVDRGRTFTRVINSYKNAPVDALNIMTYEFLKPDPEGRVDYHWIFDAVLEAMSGAAPGTPDFDCLQSTIFCKWRRPDNPYLPHILVTDQSGRCGKDLSIQTFLKTLFGGSIAGNLNIEHLLGKFNGVIAGKALIQINESSRDKVDAEKMRSFMGSPTFMVENKYEAPYECDNTALVMCFTNESVGSVSLRGSLSDERYSLFTTTSNIYEVVSRYHQAETGEVWDKNQARSWIRGSDPKDEEDEDVTNEQGLPADCGQMILRDPVQIGRWLNAMHNKYGRIRDVQPNHRTAYTELIDRQRGAWAETVAQVFQEPGFIYIRDELLGNLLQQYNRGEVIPGKKRRTEEIKRLCRDRNIPVDIQERVSIRLNASKKTIQRTVWMLNNVPHTVAEDESSYGYTDDRGHWQWTWIG